jgi:hypothetical protein
MDKLTLNVAPGTCTEPEKSQTNADSGAPPTHEPCPATVTFASPIPRTTRLLLKTGVRRENEQNWAEAGFFWGGVIRPSVFSVLQNGVPLTPLERVCQLADLPENGNPTKLADCLKKNFQPAVPSPNEADRVIDALKLRGGSGTKKEWGIFFNFNFRLPLPAHWGIKEFSFEQRGAFFLPDRRDTVVDARWREQFSAGPVFAYPRFPGLALKPTYKFFVYRSKITPNLLVGRTLEITLDYRFDWRTGSSWWQVLRYGRPK